MKIERPREGELSLLQRQCESEASSSNGTGHALWYGLCFCNVELSVCWGHVGCEKQLRRVSSALGLGIKRTKTLDSPLAVHSTEKTSLYPSGDRVGGCSRFGAALSIAVVVLWLVLHLAQRPESYYIRQERSSGSNGGQPLAINVSCYFQNKTTCILDHEEMGERGVHASVTIYGEGESVVRCIKPTKDETRCSSRFRPVV